VGLHQGEWDLEISLTLVGSHAMTDRMKINQSSLAMYSHQVKCHHHAYHLTIGTTLSSEAGLGSEESRRERVSGWPLKIQNAAARR